MIDETLSIAAGALLGLLTGLATGFYFERRSSKSVRQHNEELRRQLSVLQTLLFSLGAARGDAPVDPRAPAPDLAASVTSRALETQNAEGCVDRQHLIAHFVGHGHDVEAVEATIASLCSSGAAQEKGQWLQLT